ncbi:aquaporin [Lentinus tigrinus ALCF2SS1-7]|uniref:Aquaporin n=1 Tax=Lentinus tigrinus ALCF2SS1-6 TaxID=1328759 RepID=A0A5C2SFZ5_9APHY|nr:aquaporin [Lentinus tigrinus ALCF2SS1-6]RPD77511.1 aquaporin [Lentinus tigrinus ALCF2SS1-7]
MSQRKQHATLTSSEADKFSKEVASHHEDIASSTHHTESLDEGLAMHYTKYPNRWSRIREIIREPAAEFFGVMILIIFGAGVDCQVVLSANTSVASSPKGDYLSLAFGWAAGTALGVWVSSGISGGHINPAVTIALATFRDFPWRKVPAYVFAQLMGGLCGAGIIYANYIHAIDIIEGGRHIRTLKTAGLFSTYALDYMTSVSCFFDEFVGTAVLLIVVLAIGDARNGPPPPGLVPLVLFILILGIGIALGMQTGYAINPARDLGPRLLTAMVGYGGQVFSFRHQYWLWCPVIAPIVGALVGTFIYDALFFTGSESIVNRPDARARAHHERAKAEERGRPIAGVENV